MLKNDILKKIRIQNLCRKHFKVEDTDGFPENMTNDDVVNFKYLPLSSFYGTKFFNII